MKKNLNQLNYQKILKNLKHIYKHKILIKLK